MRIEILDSKRGVLKVRVDCEDDLWLLSMLLSPNDLVKALTTRDVSLGYEKRRIPMVLTVRVQKVEFQPFTNRLRVHGIVVDGPDRFGVIGSHHTINIDVGHEITIFKERWDPRLLEQLLRLTRPVKLAVVALDFDEYAVAIVQSQGVKIVDEKTISLPVSDESFEYEKERMLHDLAKRIVDILSRYGLEVLVIASPGTLKNELEDLVKKLNPNVRIYKDTVANGGYPGIQEVLRRGIITKILEDITLTEASKILEEFNYLLVKDPHRVAYGIKDLTLLAEMGVIDRAVVLDELLSSFDETRFEVETLLHNVVKHGGRVVIVPANSPVGQYIKNLGGAIAILRYSIDVEALRTVREENTSNLSSG